MIHSTTYFTSHCDLCRKDFQCSGDSLEKQLQLLGEKGWRIWQNGKQTQVMCSVCMAIIELAYQLGYTISKAAVCDEELDDDQAVTTVCHSESTGERRQP